MNLRMNPDGSYELDRPRRWQPGYYVRWLDDAHLKGHYCWVGNDLDEVAKRLVAEDQEGNGPGYFHPTSRVLTEFDRMGIQARVIPSDKMWRYKDDQEESKLPWE